jgi:hypothetical protein
LSLFHERLIMGLTRGQEERQTKCPFMSSMIKGELLIHIK